ncbi:vam6/Vps39-like protein [Anoplophora glabripennis]|uniref:vam6/Vps39-like protein n=1 Tax=Anoplophora glabripennis TaxID=217634 RepID=UPI0008753C44|nr:vam6/Vps39-like protein [Anoplophora glabripennis]
MHEAYQVSSLLKLTYQVESIAAYDDNLLVGTRQGHLCMYNLVRTEDNCEVQLMRYHKSFSKKAVQQLEVIPDHNLLISLTDNLVQVHDLNAINFTTIYQVLKSKGATFFAINIKKQTSMTGDISVLVRMAAVVKRKIQLYYLKNNEFLQLMDDINLTEIPRSMVWCQESICVGYRGEYALLELNGKQTDLFPTSSTRSNEPCIIRVSDTTFALCRETQTVLVNVMGETERNKALRWSDVPVTLAWDEPYALGILTDCIEVLTLEPSGLVQTLPDLSKVRFIVSAKQGLLYAASVSQIWCIQAVDVAKQRKVLVDAKQFQLALKLTQISNESEEEKKEKIHHIQTLLAYDLFHRKQFHESMKEFLKLGTDAYDVIRLFPDLLPQQQQGTDYPEPVRDLTEKELETSRLALIDYLTEMRHRLQSSDTLANINARGNLNERATSKSTSHLLQIIDTTLLKCYLQTNDALVAPLLRLNHCHLVETEKILKKMGKHNELIILYQTKGQHRRALELLQSEGSIDRTIGYLQHLGSDNMGLILEFADWVLTESPEEGLKIFTEDIAEVEALPRPRVLDFLLKSHKSVVIPYLEHVVHTWEDSNPLFHNALVHQYREKIVTEGPAVAEHTRKKLLQFLESSRQYTAENILNSFPTDSLLEERAIILGRLGKHEEALNIYVRALGDVEKAETYCRKVYDKGLQGSQNVYASLIKLILDPNSCQLTLPGLVLSPKTAQADLELALQLLEQHASRMNPLQALQILPDSVPVSRIHKFLSVALYNVIQDRRRVQLMKGLLYAEHLQCQEMKLALQSQHVLVTELNVCPVCKKRFGNQSALVRYPNGDVVHYSCQEKKLIN